VTLSRGISGHHQPIIARNSRVSLLLLDQTVEHRIHIFWLQKHAFEMAEKKIFLAAKPNIELKHVSPKMS